jgi:hypothetical protein
MGGLFVVRRDLRGKAGAEESRGFQAVGRKKRAICVFSLFQGQQRATFSFPLHLTR